MSADRQRAAGTLWPTNVIKFQERAYLLNPDGYIYIYWLRITFYNIIVYNNIYIYIIYLSGDGSFGVAPSTIDADVLTDEKKEI